MAVREQEGNLGAVDAQGVNRYKVCILPMDKFDGKWTKCRIG